MNPTGASVAFDPVTLSVGSDIPGANVVELDVAPLPNELRLENNRVLF